MSYRCWFCQMICCKMIEEKLEQTSLIEPETCLSSWMMTNTSWFFFWIHILEARTVDTGMVKEWLRCMVDGDRRCVDEEEMQRRSLRWERRSQSRTMSRDDLQSKERHRDQETGRWRTCAGSRPTTAGCHRNSTMKDLKQVKITIPSQISSKVKISLIKKNHIHWSKISWTAI